MQIYRTSACYARHVPNDIIFRLTTLQSTSDAFRIGYLELSIRFLLVADLNKQRGFFVLFCMSIVFRKSVLAPCNKTPPFYSAIDSFSLQVKTMYLILIANISLLNINHVVRVLKNRTNKKSILKRLIFYVL